MGSVRILLVEDDELQAEKVKFQLECMEYDLAGHAQNASDALALFHTTKPDLVLLDINLEGDRDGIEVAESIRAKYNTPIIFVTSLAERTTLERAKEMEPDAYLLKPLKDMELEAAIELALSRNAQPTPLSEPDKAEWQDLIIEDGIFVKVGKVLKKVMINDIIYISTSADKYCDLNTASQQLSIRRSLSDLEISLPPRHFVRIHRTTIVNTRFITEVNEAEQWLKLGELKLAIGRSFKKNLLERIQFFG